MVRALRSIQVAVLARKINTTDSLLSSLSCDTMRHDRKKRSNDQDLVPFTRYQPKSRLPAQYDELRTMPSSFKPMELDPIANPGPNLPTELDLDDPMAFFRLFFTNHLIQHLVDYINDQAARERCINLSPMLWKPVLKAEIETYLGK